MCYDVIAKSLVFAGRNNDKVFFKNDRGRIFAEVGQLGNAVAATAKLDNAVGKGTKAAIDVFCKAADNSKALSIVEKGVNIARDNVNPLLIGAAAYRVCKADDKEKALKKEIVGMSTMFGAEHMMKMFFQSSSYQNLIQKIQNPTLKAIVGILQGLLFVTGSVVSSTAGYKMGDYFFDKDNKKANNNGLSDIKTAFAEKSDTPECFQLRSGKMVA